MDFESFRLGAVQLVLGFTAALNTTFPTAVPPVSNSELSSPVVIASENLPAPILESGKAPEDIQDLNSVTDDENKLEMVTKEPEPIISQDVMLYTVIRPIPKPTITPSQKPDTLEIIKEAKAEAVEEKKSETAAVSPSPSPSATPAPALTGSNADRMFQMANDHRAKLGKASFEKDERLCKIAEQRAPQINGELATGALHKGFKELNLPYWATENIAAYQTIEDNFKFWIADYIHRIAVEGDHKYSCVACSGASCSQIFSSFVPK